MSGALDQKGIAVTLIHAGAHKVDANPYQPLPEAVRDRMQGELEDLRQLFAETVAAGRGDRPDTIAGAGTEAAVFRGEAAIFAGLADEVADPVTAFRAFAAAPRGTTTPRGKGHDDHRPRRPCAASGRACRQHPAGTGPARGSRTAAATTAAAMSPEAIRAEAAEVAQVCAQAARLGVTRSTPPMRSPRA
jgi:ClpP class serine protease